MMFRGRRCDTVLQATVVRIQAQFGPLAPQNWKGTVFAAYYSKPSSRRSIFSDGQRLLLSHGPVGERKEAGVWAWSLIKNDKDFSFAQDATMALWILPYV